MRFALFSESHKIVTAHNLPLHKAFPGLSCVGGSALTYQLTSLSPGTKVNSDRSAGGKPTPGTECTPVALGCLELQEEHSGLNAGLTNLKLEQTSGPYGVRAPSL